MGPATRGAGAHVIYGVVGLKTHCKALLIVRDADELGATCISRREIIPVDRADLHRFQFATSGPALSEEVATVFNTQPV